MASDGSDNPILDMGLLGMMQPNPYIDPAFAGKPLQLPGFRGAATDAYGKAIGAPPPGTTTLNTPPAAATAAPSASAWNDLSARVDQNTINSANANLDSNIAAGTAPGYSGRGAETGIANYPGAADALIGLASYRNQANKDYAANPDFGLGMPQQQGQQQGQQQQQQQGQSPPGMLAAAPGSRQDYLDRMASPGPPTMVGATVPASQPLGVPSVMNAFMAAHPSGGTKGAGGYDNSGFFSTLSNLRKA